MAGRVRSFTEAETEILRKLARDLKEKNDWNGTQLGKAMGGIAQQNASRFVAERSTAGIDRTTANALAISCGYRDVEHALLENGVLAEMTRVPAQGGNADWLQRDAAIVYARKLGYPEPAILAVLHRYTEPDYRTKKMRWWNDRIVLEAIARKDEESETEAQPTMPAPPARRRKSGTEG